MGNYMDMRSNTNWRADAMAGSVLCLLLCLTGWTRAAGKESPARQKARAHWERVVLFYGEEETGEWSLRIRDRDVHDKGWFEFLELWKFNIKDHKWHSIPVEKVSTAVVLPKNKPSDAPPDTQMLMPLNDVPPQTAGLWYAKWRMDGIEGGTMMRVGTSHAKISSAPDGDPPPGMLKMAVPIDLNKSETMLVPDPRAACVKSGAGAAGAKSGSQKKPADSDADKDEKADKKGAADDR